MDTGKVAILSMDEIADEVRTFLAQKCRESINHFLDAGPDFWMTNARGITAKDEKGNYIRQKDLVQTWCDHCSVKFFETNGDNVDEVLVDVSTNPEHNERVWLASFR